MNKLNLDKGYKVVKCDERVEAAQCDVVCNPLTHSGTAHVQCSTDGSDFVVSGCSENRCYAPEGDSNKMDFNFDNCRSSKSHPILSSECHVKCPVNFNGDVNAVCRRNGDLFSVEGSSCKAKQCKIPEHGIEGYDTSGCSGGFKSSSECHLKCADGYSQGNREIYAFCTSDHGGFSATGCHINKCTVDKSKFNPTNGYDLSQCSNGDGLLSEQQCKCSCFSGFTGNPTLKCPNDQGPFTISPHGGTECTPGKEAYTCKINEAETTTCSVSKASSIRVKFIFS